MKQLIKLKVNGELYDVVVEPQESLLDVLRNKIGLTGAKIGCKAGQCGTCTVLIDGRAFRSCLFLAMKARNKDITTIEGLADGEDLHPLQRAFIEQGAVQCGFCTPGMILSAKDLLDEHPDPTEDEIKKAIAGNLCRCTGYTKIIEAIQAVAQGRERKGG
jgi:carbon-monoxide dehydrogenase small subunit